MATFETTSLLAKEIALQKDSENDVLVSSSPFTSSYIFNLQRCVSLRQMNNNDNLPKFQSVDIKFWEIIDEKQHGNVLIALLKKRRKIMWELCLVIPTLVFLMMSIFFLGCVLALAGCAVVELVLDNTCVDDVCEYCSIAAGGSTIILFVLLVVDVICCSLACMLCTRRYDTILEHSIFVYSRDYKYEELFPALAKNPYEKFRLISTILNYDVNEILDLTQIVKMISLEQKDVRYLWETSLENVVQFSSNLLTA